MVKTKFIDRLQRGRQGENQIHHPITKSRQGESDKNRLMQEVIKINP